jgi:hypothetical protein
MLGSCSRIHNVNAKNASNNAFSIVAMTSIDEGFPLELVQLEKYYMKAGRQRGTVQ